MSDTVLPFSIQTDQGGYVVYEFENIGYTWQMIFSRMERFNQWENSVFTTKPPDENLSYTPAVEALNTMAEIIRDFLQSGRPNLVKYWAPAGSLGNLYIAKTNEKFLPQDGYIITVDQIGSDRIVSVRIG